MPRSRRRRAATRFSPPSTRPWRKSKPVSEAGSPSTSSASRRSLVLEPARNRRRAAPSAPPAARLRGCGRRATRRCGRNRRRSKDGARWRSRCGPASRARAPSRMAASDSLSSADVASSSSRIGAALRIARAIAMRWRCPPDSFTPRSPMIVAKPCGSNLDELGAARRRGRGDDRAFAEYPGGRNGYSRSPSD